MDGPFLGLVLSVLNIVVIDIVLAGDNALVIAMAVRSLPQRQRLKGILIGSGAAVLLRVALTFGVAQLLDIPFLKLAGGLAILWIAVKLVAEGACEEKEACEAQNLWHALRLIVVADITMSLDNVLAVAGASHGSLSLLVFGLLLSIPLVVFSSNLLAKLMDRYPVIIWVGAAILGRVGGEMILGDPLVLGWLQPAPLTTYLGQAVFALGVLATGRLWLNLRFRTVKAE
ncbi:MAG: TerC family protein [Desulfarculus sp.]|nr:TerC family protein [Desulfarculus sp.]